jgi:hypothetical protein
MMLTQPLGSVLAPAIGTLSQVHIHPGYDSSDITSVDLAMVRLNSPILNPVLPLLVSTPSWPVVDQILLVIAGV